MIKPLLLAVWVSAVSLGAVYGVFMMQTKEDIHNKEKGSGEIEYVKPEEISVPMIVDGKVTGYVIAQFAFTTDSELLKQLSVSPDYIFNNEAFNVIYESKVIDFTKIKKHNLPAVAVKIKKNINKRMQSEFVRDVLIQQLKYVPKSSVRTH
jgi:hypothetical protein